MVMDVEFVGQLVEAMGDAVLKLEKAVEEKKPNDVNKLRTFIFDLYRQVDTAVGEAS